MNKVWWVFVRFIRDLFVPPEYTPLEKELLRQISYLEGELHRSREKYNELAERVMFPNNSLPQEQPTSFSVPTPRLPVHERRRQLEDLSKQRYLEHADKVIKEAEERLRLRDEKSNKEGIEEDINIASYKQSVLANS